MKPTLPPLPEPCAMFVMHTGQSAKFYSHEKMAVLHAAAVILKDERDVLAAKLAESIENHEACKSANTMLLETIRELENELTPEIMDRRVSLKSALEGWRHDGRPCHWTESTDPDMPDTYHSDCGEMWSFIDGGPAENRVRYCHSCGRPMVEVKNEQESEPEHDE